MQIQAVQIAEKLKDLHDQFNCSKKIIIKNGISWEIEGLAFNALKARLKEIFSINFDPAKVYSLYEGDTAKKNYEINILGYLWKHIFHNFYDQVYFQRKEYDFKTADILRAQTIDELNSITYRFAPATTLDVSQKVTELLSDNNTPAYVLDAITKAGGSDGGIHIVKIV